MNAIHQKEEVCGCELKWREELPAHFLALPRNEREQVRGGESHAVSRKSSLTLRTEKHQLLPTLSI